MSATLTETPTVLLPTVTGGVAPHAMSQPIRWRRPTDPPTSRIVYAAAHVVPRPLGENVPGAPADIDWDATLAYRHEIWSYGLGVADAMDTAQRGMGLAWPQARELIRRSGAEAAAVGARVSCGAGTDQLVAENLPSGSRALTAVIEAYREQLAVVLDAGATPILMASRALTAIARSADDYLHVYGTLLDELDRPVILHWLGDMFDPALHGYWGSTDIPTATATFLDLISRHATKVDGVKVSLLDARHEIELRRSLPAGVLLYTGDDFNYPELIVGDGDNHSHALLGIFAAIYPAASAALQCLDAGNAEQARQILDSTQDLGRLIFARPTFHYKTGIAFLSWLNGLQPAFSMVGGMHSARSVPHLSEVFRLADRAGLLKDPDLAAQRMRLYLELHGFGQKDILR